MNLTHNIGKEIQPIPVESLGILPQILTVLYSIHMCGCDRPFQNINFTIAGREKLIIYLINLDNVWIFNFCSCSQLRNSMG